MHGPHPRLVINSSVISVFITQTEIDIQGSDSSRFLLRKKVPFFKHLETWKISAVLFDCFIVLFMKAGSAPQYLHTNKLPLFQLAFSFDSCQCMAYFWKCIMKLLWLFFFCDRALMRLLLLNIAIIFAKLFSWERLYLSPLRMTKVSWLMFNEKKTIKLQKACVQRTRNL